jgi:hypothetical protein
MVVADKLIETSDAEVKKDDEERSARKHERDTGDIPGDVVNGVYTDGDGTRYVKAFTDTDGTDVFRVEGRTGGLLYQSISRIPGVRATLWGVPVPESVRSQNTGSINSDDVMRYSDGALYRPNGTQYGRVKDGTFIPLAKTRVSR